MTPSAILREQGLRLIRRLGWAGGSGLALLAFAIVLDVLGAAALERRRDELVAERTRLLRPPQAQAGGASAVERFYAAFPAERGLPRSLANVSVLAENHGLNAERTAYRSAAQPGTPLLRVSLSLPVQGSYGALHAWLAEMLATMPEVALESLAVRRLEPAADLVEADVALAVFARREP